MTASRRAPHQRGQVLIIAAVAMVVLLLIAAIVIDLGFSWMLLRQEQNAADPGSVAAARFITYPSPNGPPVYDAAQGRAAACAYAISNGIFEASNTNCDSALDPNHATLTVKYPPDQSAGPPWTGDRGYVQVKISKRHDSFFGAILGQSFATVGTQAVAARKIGPADTATIRVEDPHDCESMKIHGGAYLHIYPGPTITAPGGFVYVSSDCGGNTSDDQCDNNLGALAIQGTTAAMWAPKTNVVGSCKSSQSDEPHGPLDEAFAPLGDPLSGLRFPSFSGPGQKCGQSGPSTTPTGSNSKGCGAGGGPIWAPSADTACPGLPSGYKCVVLSPGIYYGGWTIGSKLRVTLQPGIYVIAGGGVSIGSTGSLDSLNGGSSPAPVLIFNTDNPAAAGCPTAGPGCQQDMSLTAGTGLELRGLLPNAACPPVTSPTATGCPFGNMLFWYDQFGSQSASHTGDLTIDGGTQLYIAGTIYAPAANVKIIGHSTTNTNGEVCPGVDGAQPIPGKTIAAVQIIAWTIDIGGTGDVCMPYDPNQLWKLNQQGLVH